MPGRPSAAGATRAPQQAGQRTSMLTRLSNQLPTTAGLLTLLTDPIAGLGQVALIMSWVATPAMSSCKVPQAMVKLLRSPAIRGSYRISITWLQKMSLAHGSTEVASLARAAWSAFSQAWDLGFSSMPGDCTATELGSCEHWANGDKVSVLMFVQV